jgi:hypothetical protein
LSTLESQAEQFCPVEIKASSGLAKALRRLAGKFPLDGGEVNIGLDPKLVPCALITEFKLGAAAAAKLGRQENLLECVAAPVNMVAATKRRIQSYLQRVKVPRKVADTSTYFVVIVRRRGLPPGAAGRFDLGNNVPIDNEIGFILGLAADHKNVIATIIHSDYYVQGIMRKGGATVVTLPRCGTGADASGGGSGTQAQPQPDPDNTQDFTQCYLECLANIPPFLITLAAVACATCSVALAIAASTGGGAGVTAAGLVIACAACAAVVGAILGNCLLTCLELL